MSRFRDDAGATVENEGRGDGDGVDSVALEEEAEVVVVVVVEEEVEDAVDDAVEGGPLRDVEFATAASCALFAPLAPATNEDALITETNASRSSPLDMCATMLFLSDASRTLSCSGNLRVTSTRKQSSQTRCRFRAWRRRYTRWLLQSLQKMLPQERQ